MSTFQLDDLPLSEVDRVDELCDQFERAWRSGTRPRIEAYLEGLSDAIQSVLLRELIGLELELRSQTGEPHELGEWLHRFPQQERLIRTLFDPTVAPEGPGGSTPAPDHVNDDIEASPTAKVPGELSTATGFWPPNRPSLASFELDPRKDPGGPWSDDDLLPHASPAVAIGPGQRLGDYLLLNRVDGGGMGVVYRARQLTSDRLVALKLIRPVWGEHQTEGIDPLFEDLFRNEIRLAAQLDGHPHIATVYHAGRVAGRFFYVMRYFEGPTLSQLLKRSGPLNPRQAAAWMKTVAEAIHYAHQRQIIHRDLKPSNILIDNGQPYVVDFGLATLLEKMAQERRFGQQPAGTLPYIAPEVVRRVADATPASDIYSLGVTFYEMLTGRKPFQGENRAEILRKIVEEAPEPPRRHHPEVPPELEFIALKCLEKAPERRYASTADLAEDLGRFLAGETVGPVSWRRQMVKWTRRHPTLAWSTGVAAIALLALGLFLIGYAWEQRNLARHDVARLATATTTELPRLVENLARRLWWARGPLTELAADHPHNPRIQARVALALLPAEPVRALTLADRLVYADPDEHRLLRLALVPHAARVSPRLQDLLDNPEAPVERRARAAAALIALRDAPDFPEDADNASLDLLRHREDETAASRLIAWLDESRVETATLLRHLSRETDPAIRRGLIQALGSYQDQEPPDGVTPKVLDTLWDLYLADPDREVHASLFALLNGWGLARRREAIDLELVPRDAPWDGSNLQGRSWYVNSIGLTMIVLDARRDGPLPGGLRRLAVAMTEVPHGAVHALLPDISHINQDSINPREPCNPLSYYQAVRFCRRLSEQEAIQPDQMNYPPLDQIGPSLTLGPDFTTRRGYRLMTIDEWEHLGRAGTSTDFFFGSDPDLLSRYGWIASNSPDRARPVGLLRPSPFGLLDLLGNTNEWCFNPAQPLSCDCPDPNHQAAPRMPTCRPLQALRGGSIRASSPQNLTVSAFRQAIHNRWLADQKIIATGFRIVRTLE